MNDVQHVSPDTTAVLLLCGRFGRGSVTSVEALNSSEYARLEKWLLERQLRPAHLLGADHPGLSEVIESRLDPERLRALLGRGTTVALATEKWLRSGLWVLSRCDAQYPSRLKMRLGAAAPLLLHGAGDATLLEHGGLAIVGSRQASDDALRFAAQIGARCASEGVCIVSGGARGVDAAAMEAAAHAGGEVIGVLADGLLYAVRKRDQRIGIEKCRLVLVSPYNPEAGFDVGNAMARNRHIYALADHGLIVEATLRKGGTWSGAVENLRNGWVPLLVRNAPEAVGNVALIEMGGHRFAYDPQQHQSLRVQIDESAHGERGDQHATPSLPGEQLLKEQAPVYDVDHVSSASSQGDSPSLDLYAEFVRRLHTVLHLRKLGQAEIASQLGLTASQAKAWLARAEQEGIVMRRGKSRRYELPVPTLF